MGSPLKYWSFPRRRESTPQATGNAPPRELDSRLRGNGCTWGRSCLANDTSTLWLYGYGLPYPLHFCRATESRGYGKPYPYFTVHPVSRVPNPVSLIRPRLEQIRINFRNLAELFIPEGLGFHAFQIGQGIAEVGPDFLLVTEEP